MSPLVVLVEEPVAMVPSTYEAKGSSLMNHRDARLRHRNTLGAVERVILGQIAGCFAPAAAMG